MTTETVAQMVTRLAKNHVGPGDISKAILGEIGGDADALYSALEETLSDFVRTRLGFARRRQVDIPEGYVAPVTPITPGGYVSPKVAGIAAWHAEALARQYHTANGYRRLGDLTVEDLTYAAEERSNQAGGLLFEAKRLQRMAAALTEYEATVVSELPESVIAEILQRAS